MRTDFHRASRLGAVVVAALSLSVAGCALTKGDLAAHDSVPAVATSVTLPGTVDVKPAVLVQNGGVTPAVTTTVQPTRTANVDSLPPLPKGDAAPTSSAPSSKLLSPEEKARVVAELEALARGEPAKPPAAAKPDCTVTASVKTGTAQTAANTAAACANAPKPALRP